MGKGPLERVAEGNIDAENFNEKVEEMEEKIREKRKLEDALEKVEKQINEIEKEAATLGEARIGGQIGADIEGALLDKVEEMISEEDDAEE